MRPLAIHTYENFAKMFYNFHLAGYLKVSTFFDTLGIEVSELYRQIILIIRM